MILLKIEFEQTPAESEGQGKPGMLQSLGSQRVGHDWVTEQQSRYKKHTYSIFFKQ